jgi:hypothetical protein
MIARHPSVPNLIGIAILLCGLNFALHWEKVTEPA